MLTSLALSAALLTACAPEQAPAQLEALSVEITSGASASEGSLSATGTLHVVGEGRDYQLTVDGPTPLEVELHLPGGSDLTQLDGRFVTVTVNGAVYSDGNRSMAIYDGGLVFLAQNSWDDSLSEGWFGADLVDWGEAVYTERREDETWRWTSAVFQDDAVGDVVLFPGEVAALQARDREWRVVVNAAWQVEGNGLFDTACSGPGDLLSFELLRTALEDVEENTTLSAEGGRSMVLGCDAR